MTYDPMPETHEEFVTQCLAEYPIHAEALRKYDVELLREEQEDCEDLIDSRPDDCDVALCHLAWINAELARRI